ncbi:uncharacterized protein C18orf19 homolog A-like [Ptychodera flava]|uniref:uncharacterized protein C18orf19 homolog A-like n=1 Tax=Ptychodera flava TaxID=63121 RepID=UPI003969DEDA
MASAVFRRLSVAVARAPTTTTRFFNIAQDINKCRCISFFTKVSSVPDLSCESHCSTFNSFALLQEGVQWKLALLPSYPKSPSFVSCRHFSTKTESKVSEQEHDQKKTDSGKTEADQKLNSVEDENVKAEAVDSKAEQEIDETLDFDSEELQKLSLWERYKILLKQYSKVMIPVHIATSCVWYSSFYFTVTRSGVDMVPLIERFLAKIGVGESIITAINTPTASGLLIAYAMYKIATPARYTITLGGTTFMVRYLRKKGVMDEAPPKDQTLREAMKESMSDMKERSIKTLEKRKQQSK